MTQEIFFGHFFGFSVIFLSTAAPPQIFYRSPAFRICTGCLPKYVWNLLKIGFKNTYFQVFQGFPALKETVAHIQSNGRFWTVFCQNGRNGIFSKRLEHLFPPLQALTNCKFSEKSNEQISRKAVANGRTDGRTDGQTDGRTDGRTNKRTNGRTRAKFKVLSNSSTNQ